MRFFKRGYDNTYFDTFIDFSIYKKFDARQKVKLIKSVKASGSILEIGCGKGELLNELKKDYSVSGFDVSPSAIAYAKKSINQKDRGAGKLSVLNIEEGKITGKFDVILAFDVLEHLKDPRKCIMKIKKALKKNGIFIFTVPNNYGLYGKLMTNIFNFIDKTHISTYPRMKWIRILEEIGFTLDIRNNGLFEIVRSWIGKYISFNLLVIARK